MLGFFGFKKAPQRIGRLNRDIYNGIHVRRGTNSQTGPDVGADATKTSTKQYLVTRRL